MEKKREIKEISGRTLRELVRKMNEEGIGRGGVIWIIEGGDGWYHLVYEDGGE